VSGKIASDKITKDIILTAKNHDKEGAEVSWLNGMDIFLVLVDITGQTDHAMQTGETRLLMNLQTT